MELEEAVRRKITAKDILDDTLLLSVNGTIDESFVERQLEDTSLVNADLDALSEMDFEELVHSLVIDSARLSNLLEDSDEGEAVGQPPMAGEQGEEASKITVLIDNMGVKAVIVLHECAPGGKPPTKAEIEAELNARGIVKGVRQEFILRLAEHPIYERGFRIADGKMPVNGVDGSAVFHFDPNVDLTPHIAEDGSADFKSLDFVKNVKQGELLCELIPPTKGEAGFSIMGDTLPGTDGRPSPVMPGNNVTLSEDGCKIFAACDGQVFFKNNRVGVSRVLVVDDVDASTGNILFVGSVMVQGDVREGFMVQAGGNITVRGAVENATLVAGRDIVLLNGVNGTSGGRLKAGGSVRARFIENARVEAHDAIHADVVLNSQLECGGAISVAGKRGCLIGGKSLAGTEIFAYEVGNRSFVATSLKIAQSAVGEGERLEALRRIAKYRESIERLQTIAESAKDAAWDDGSGQSTLVRVAYLKRRLEQEIADMEPETPKEAPRKRRAQIRVGSDLFPNVTMEIHGVSSKNSKHRGPCTIHCSKDKLMVTNGRY